MHWLRSFIVQRYIDKILQLNTCFFFVSNFICYEFIWKYRNELKTVKEMNAKSAVVQICI